MVMPFWFWFLTTAVVLAAIGVSAIIVVFLKADEVYAEERKKTANATSPPAP